MYNSLSKSVRKIQMDSPRFSLEEKMFARKFIKGSFNGKKNRILFFGVILAVLLILRSGEARPQVCDKEPTGVEAADYMLNFQTENMPDPNLNGLQAQLRVHWVRPVYANGKCNEVPNLAVVMIHGRSSPGSPLFDVRHPTAEDPEGGALSVQDALARKGIDSFARDLLGYGGSSRLALDDHCNASLPAFVAPLSDGTCPPQAPFPISGACCPVAAGCDRTRNAVVFPLNQQASHPVGLGINPGEPLCSHSSSHYFSRTDVFAHNILLVIDDAIAKAQPRGGKVVLLGYSFGGPSTARALYLLGDEAEQKVGRVIFVASVFNIFPGVQGVVALPNEAHDLSRAELSTSLPLSLDRGGGWAGVPGGPGGVRDQICTGRVIINVPEEFAKQSLALEHDFGAQWGGSAPNVV